MPGRIHGFQNDSLAPVYLQVMLGRGRPDTMGYATRILTVSAAINLMAAE